MLLALVLGTTTFAAAALDAELRAAIDALVKLERYRFHAEGERTPSTSADARPVSFVADGSFELGRPLRLEQEELAVLRDEGRTAFADRDGAWHEDAAALPAERRTRAAILASLPAPHELAALVERHAVSCTRIDEDDPRSGGVLTFECVLDEEGSRRLAPRGAIVAIRVVLDGARRRIDQLIVEPAAPPDEVAKPDAPLELFLHYQVRRQVRGPLR